MNGVKIGVYRNIVMNGIEFYVIVRGSPRPSLARPLEFEEHDPAEVYYQPTFFLEPKAAQELMDDLWSCGLRPSEGSGSAGALAATERHLEDMRRLVFENGHKTKPPE